MVHPDDQRKGIFGSLLKKSIELAESEGYDMLITFSNNPFSLQGFLKIGFHDIASMRWLKTYLSIDTTVSKYVDSFPIPLGVKKIILSLFSRFFSLLTPLVKHSYQLQHGTISEFTGQLTKFSSYNSNGGMSGVRTKDFIQWRFFRDDTCFRCLALVEHERMVGYLILQCKKGDKDAFIVDMRVSNNDKSLIPILMSETRRYLKKNNFLKLWVYIQENDSNLSNFFSLRNGFFCTIFKSRKNSINQDF